MHAIVAIAIFLALPFALTSLQHDREAPTAVSTTPQKNFPDIAQAAVRRYHAQKINHQSRMTSLYQHDGDYLDYGTTKQYRDSDRVRLDQTGLPQVRYGEAFHYNPVTLAQYALTMHGRYTKGDQDALDNFKKASRKLLELQDLDGAFRYQFPYKYYLTGEVLRPGWISGMAQGQALSVFARAFLITKDRRYLDAGNKALDFLLKPIEDGGPRSTLKDFDSGLSKLLFFEEYISIPNNYTLNGYMFALLGLYDWSEIQKRQYGNVNHASHYFQRGLQTLKVLLPYYDIDGFTAYDLGHYVIEKQPHIAERYHAVHLSLLQALNSVAPSKSISDALQRWSSYVE